MQNLSSFRVIVWHRDDVNGAHQSILVSGATERGALSDLSKYLTRPWIARSFTPRHLVQLHGPSGLIRTIEVA